MAKNVKCAVCGEDRFAIISTFTISSMKGEQICMRCMDAKFTQECVDMEELDRKIESYEELAAMYDELVRRSQQEKKQQDSWNTITPMNSYRSIQFSLAEMRIRKLELYTQIDYKTRLHQELKFSIEREEYERAAKIEQRLQDLQDEEKEKNKV